MDHEQLPMESMQCYPYFPVGADDQQRIDFLHGLKVLDSSREAEYDMVCRLAALHFHVPIVNISLVDAERQWFKSHLGLSACETSRDVAFCNYTVLSDQVFEVLDATLDTRFKDNPLVTGDLSIRYYCGFPIVMGPYTIGAFCLISDVARSVHLDADGLEFGENCARIISKMLEKRKLLRDSVVNLERYLVGPA